MEDGILICGVGLCILQSIPSNKGDGHLCKRTRGVIPYHT